MHDFPLFLNHTTLIREGKMRNGERWKMKDGGMTQMWSELGWQLWALRRSCVWECLQCCFIISVAQLKILTLRQKNTLIRLGFLTPFGLSAGLAHLVTPLLFLGPLYGSYLRGELPFQRNWMWETHIENRFFSVHGLRNYWIAPITEEVVFRACVLSIYHLSGASKKYMIYFAPLTFGLAHVHHVWDTYNRYGRTQLAIQRALAMTTFQLCYTTLFGMHVSYLFLRTGSILPPITAHIWCNIMGIPEIVRELKMFPRHRQIIIAAYLSGIGAFIYTLQKWTQTTGNFYWPWQAEGWTDGSILFPQTLECISLIRLESVGKMSKTWAVGEHILHCFFNFVVTL